MALRYADCVSEQIVVTGIGPVTLGASVTPGYLGFSQIPGIASGDTFYYTIRDPIANAFEVGIGTYASGAPATFSRTALASFSGLSGQGASPVNFAGNLCFVYLDVPAEALATLSYRRVTTTYTGSGAIAITDDIAVINSASNLAMTLAAGTVDARPITIKNIGTGTPTVTAPIDGSARGIALAAAGASGSVLRLRWIASLSSYILE